MKRTLAGTVLLLCAATASGATPPAPSATPPAPTFSLKCPTEGSHHHRGALTLIWDGERFSEVPEFEQPKMWRVERSEMVKWALEEKEFIRSNTQYPAARTFYLNAAQTPDDIRLNRRQLINVHTLGDLALGSTTFFYSKAQTVRGAVIRL